MVPPLIADISTVFSKDEQGLLAQNNDINLLRVSIIVQSNLPRLLPNISDPHRFHLGFRIVFLCLVLLLLLNIVVRECFHRLVIVALNLQVGIRYDHTVATLRINHRTWYQEVRQLDFEQH